MGMKSCVYGYLDFKTMMKPLLKAICFISITFVDHIVSVPLRTITGGYIFI